MCNSVALLSLHSFVIVTVVKTVFAFSVFSQRSFCLFVEFGMEEHSEIELFIISYWADYLAHIIICLLALPVLTVIYFSIKRRYTSTQTSVIEQNSTEESEIYTSSENNVFNESSFESLNLELEKTKELLCQLDKRNESSEVLHPLSKYIGTEDKRDHVLQDSSNYNELFNTTSKFDVEKTMDTVYSNYGYSEDEMQESNNFTKFQDVLDNSKLNSDSHSTINSWKSCNKDISHSESDYLNSLSSENLEINQPLNLCTKDNNNETETIEKKTFFTDRRHKKSKDILMVYPDHFICSETIKDEHNILKLWNKLKNEYISKNTKIHLSLLHDKMKNSNYFYNKEHSLNTGKQEHSLENTENGMKHENHLEISKVSTINQKIEESKNEDNLNNTELFSINHNELGDEYNMENIEHSLNEDELMLENNLETTEISAINRDEPLYEYYLKSPELSLNNDKSISGTDSHNINSICDYETQGITDLNSSTSESTESLPSPIYQNNNSIDDIRYVEDYNDVSFFDPSLSEDAMNQAFVED